jgi:putative NADH-flavin reductase
VDASEVQEEPAERRQDAPRKSSSVLVLGASGPLGRAVVDRALAGGHAVTAFVRDPERYEGPGGIAVVKGDVLDAESLARAVPGHDAVVWAVGGPNTKEGRAALPDTCERGTRHLIEAMDEAGVRRLVAVSVWGVGGSRKRAPLPIRLIVFDRVIRDEIADKTRQEELLRASDLDWTVVRPPRLTDGPATGQFRHAEELKYSARSQLSRSDLAGFMLDELERGAYVRKTVEISA